MTRAAIYARVSTDEQAEKYGLDSQVFELREMANARGLKVISEYKDDESGTVLNRPRLTELMDALRAGEFDVVLIYDTDRLARDTALFYFLTEEIGKHARIIWKLAPNENSAEDQALMGMKVVFGNYDRLKILERTARGKREMVRRGLFPGGHVPYGYEMDPEKPGTFRVCEEEAQWVRQMYRWAGDGCTNRWITAELQRLGVRSKRGKPFARSTVQWMLKTPLYMGNSTFTTAGKPVVIPVPVVVTHDLHAQVQAQMQRNIDILSGRPATRPYLLRGLLHCGVCGRRYAGSRTKSAYYRCRGKSLILAAPCKSPYLPAEATETQVWAFVVERLRHPDLLRQAVESRSEAKVEVRSSLDNLKRQLLEAERREGKLIELFVDHDVKSDAVAASLKLAQQRKAGLVEQIANARADVERRAAIKDHEANVRLACRRILEDIDGLDGPGRQRVIASLIHRIDVLPDYSLDIHGTIPELSTAPSETDQSVRSRRHPHHEP